VNEKRVCEGTATEGEKDYEELVEVAGVQAKKAPDTEGINESDRSR